MEPSETKCFDIYRECVRAKHDGILIRQVSSRDKEFHFQNWCQDRLNTVGLHFEGTGRNIYPDFCLVERPEGYEIKALAYPGREKTMMQTVMFHLVFIMEELFIIFLVDIQVILQHIEMDNK